MNLIENQTYDKERSLYNLEKSKVINCTFAGAQDGESVLKEARDIYLNSCYFNLRYPLWHVLKFKVENTTFKENSRAPIWYCQDGELNNCQLDCIKAVRECDGINISNSTINSEEFGWKSNNIRMENSNINSVYIFLDSKNIYLKNVNFTGKYSFQYDENVLIEDSYLDTKDAFWHSKNVIVKNSTLKGEYLGWYSNNLTLINCRIIGTQPLCYCKNLRLINCQMIDCDLSFEYSEVEATINGTITSIKNPKSGIIKVDRVEEIILENSIIDNNCQIITKE